VLALAMTSKINRPRLSKKIALLTAEFAGLRTQIASIERSLACLRTGTILFAKREGASDLVLKQLQKEG